MDKKKQKQKNSLEGHENFGMDVPTGRGEKKKKNRRRYNEDDTADGQEPEKKAKNGEGEMISKESEGKERKRDKKKKKEKGADIDNKLEHDVPYNVGKVINGSEGNNELPKDTEGKETYEKKSHSSVQMQRKEMEEKINHSSVETQRKRKKKDKKSNYCTLDPSEVHAEHGKFKGTNKAGFDDKERNTKEKKHRNDEKSAFLVSGSPMKGSCDGTNKTLSDKDLAKSKKFIGLHDKMIKKKKEKRKKEDCVSEFKDTNTARVDDKDRKIKKKKHREDDEPASLIFESSAEGTCDGRNDLTKGEGFRGSDDKMNKKMGKRKKKKMMKDGETGFEVATSNESELCSDSKKKRKRKNAVDDSTTATEKQKQKKKKRVSFSGAVEVFPLDGDSENEEAEEQLIYGKRFTLEEDQKVRDAIDEYITKHQLGEEGIQMVLKCKKYPQTKNCWKEIGACIPYRPRAAIYYRAHCLLERSELRKWTPEEYEEMRSFYKTHGADWRTLADKLGKHRFHVKDAWRRVKSPNFKQGHWSQDEYQTLFDLVNLDLRMKANEEKDSKHGMLRDNIHWEAISDKLSTRFNGACCVKWYNQLTSPLVSQGVWADVDDYRLIDELKKTDACCIEDVDWDNLLEHRSGEICRRRWHQMARHLGSNREKPFIEQLEVLSKRYCPEMVEYRK